MNDPFDDDIPRTIILAQFATESGAPGGERIYIVHTKSDRDAILGMLINNSLCYQVEVK